MECADEINQMRTVGCTESELGHGGDMGPVDASCLCDGDGLDKEPRRQEEQGEVTEIAGGYQLASRFCRTTGARRNI